MDRFQRDVIDHYDAHYTEMDRLSRGGGALEMARTLDILRRFLPTPPATILDVGGAAGAYSFPLAKRGYAVHLSDLTPRHIQQARERGRGPRTEDLRA